MGADGVDAQKKTWPNTLLRCNICSCEMSSDLVYEAHITGSKHKKRLKALEIVKNLKAEKGVEVGPQNSPNAYRCEVCLMTLNSPQQLEVHLSGSKHRSKIAKDQQPNIGDNNVEATNNPVVAEEVHNVELPPSKKRKKETKFLNCDICNITVNSETQYEQHILSKKHIGREKGEINSKRKPTKMEIRQSYFRNFVPGSRYQAGKEIDRNTLEGYKPTPPFATSNISRLVPSNPSAVSRPNMSYNQMNSDGMNKGPYNNFSFQTRPFINNQRNYGVADMGKFFPKVRYNSRDPMMNS